MRTFVVRPIETVRCDAGKYQCTEPATHRVEHRHGSRVGLYCKAHAEQKAKLMNRWEDLVVNQSRRE